jgi:hypothetical protein
MSRKTKDDAITQWVVLTHRIILAKHQAARLALNHRAMVLKERSPGVAEAQECQRLPSTWRQTRRAMKSRLPCVAVLQCHHSEKQI